MASEELPLLVIPADEPVQMGDSPQLARLDGRVTTRLYRDCPADAEQLVQRAKDANILINSRGHVQWPRELLGQLPNLRMISTCSIGTDAIDLQAARELGIVVSNIPGRTAPVVSEHALALMLATARRLAFQTQRMRQGRWERTELIFLAGKRLGIVGCGAIGAATARLAQAIGINVVAWTFHPSAQRSEELGIPFVSWEELWDTCDVVSLHIKLTEQSRHLVGRSELRRMKPGSLLINTARGAIVDHLAMVEALQSGHLGGAGLDVFPDEPLAADDPILQCDQVVLTPHAADQTPEGADLLNGGAVDNVLAFLQGSPQNVVT